MPRRTRIPDSAIPVRPVTFPGARLEELADSPARCVCGGAWHLEDAALACRLCGRRLYVASELRRFVARYGFGGRGA